MPLNRTWTIAGPAALLFGAATGLAVTNDSLDLRDRTDPVELQSSSPVDDILGVDASPESADSPGESPFDSPESPTDSPDDPGFVDPSPESADSPGDSPFDSPAPAPASSGGGDSPDSPDSPESADSPDSD
jgi:hypothetical protein